MLLSDVLGVAKTFESGFLYIIGRKKNYYKIFTYNIDFDIILTVSLILFLYLPDMRQEI